MITKFTKLILLLALIHAPIGKQPIADDIESRMSELRTLYESENRNDAALALAIGMEEELRTNISTDHLYYVEICTKIVGLYKRMDMPELAIPYSDRALNTLRSFGETESFLYGVTLMNAAFLFRSTGDADQEVGLFEEAVDFFGDSVTDTQSGNYQIFIQSAQELGATYDRLGMHEELTALIEKVEEITRTR